MKRFLIIGLLSALGLILLVPAASLYYEAGSGKGCTSCHEMNAVYDRWHGSSHRNIACEKCHGGAFTLDASFHWNNATRVVSHLKGDLPEQIGFPNKYVQGMTGRCRVCHQQEYTAWAAGPHSANYSRIFLDPKHNQKTMLMDDCLRCHGMHFEGGVRDLITPIARQGPWSMVPQGASNMASMPCLTCHEMHREGPPLTKSAPDGRASGPTQEISRPSLALFDRRSQRYVPIADLPMPAMLDGARPVRMSKDQRQALCYQCHAPTAPMQVGSGDDRTSIGVHEGISCLACHAQHGQTTRASCATCHPKMSNCGLNVEQMDTSFRSTSSRHNVHFMKCQDCHTKGIPKKKDTLAAAAGAGLPAGLF